MNVLIDISEERFDDISRIASVQLKRRIPTVEQIIANGTTIEPERKKGKWIEDGTELGCCCSECGVMLDSYISNLNEDNHLTQIPNFCPNCGADTRGEQDESD